MKEFDKNIDRIIDEAAEWFILMDGSDSTDKDQENFALWLNESSFHRREFAEVSGLWDEAALYGAELDSSSGAVYSFSNTQKPKKYPTQKIIFWQDWRKIAALLFVGVMITGSVSFILSRPDTMVEVASAQNFETRKGESRRFSLEDGSFVELNTDSHVEVDFSTRQRKITLVKGEVFFEVAKDKFKPFIVTVDNTQVKAIGTQFNIHKRLEKIEVTVLEGKVRVSNHGKSGSYTSQLNWVRDLSAGEQVIAYTGPSENNLAAKNMVYMPEKLNLSAVLSWRNNKLIFDNRELIDVIEDFNRYNDQTMVLVDIDLQKLKISGTFNPNDPESFIQSLEQLANIRSEANPDGSILLYKAR